MNRLLRASLLLYLPLLLLPTLLPRKVSAKRLSGPGASTGPVAHNAEPTLPREKTIQDVVDELRTRLSIPDAVMASLVPENRLVVSVERMRERERGFQLSLESTFIAQLTGEELRAVVAHELGHVWIFTHHPYLQTEELANQIALQVVDRGVLEEVYEKVWARIGNRGKLTYLPVE